MREKQKRLVAQTGRVERQVLVVEVVDSHDESIPERPDDSIPAFNGDTAAGSDGTDAKQRDDLVPAIEGLLRPQLVALPALAEVSEPSPDPIGASIRIAGVGNVVVVDLNGRVDSLQVGLTGLSEVIE